MDKEKGIKLAAAVVLVVVAVILVARNFSPRTSSVSKFYYYDLGTGELFTAAPAIPPIAAPSGPDKGVRASVVACGSCDKKENRKIQSLETYTPEGKQALSQAANNPSAMDTAEKGHMFAAEPPKGSQPVWVSKMDPVKSAAIMQSLAPCPGGATAISCLP